MWDFFTLICGIFASLKQITENLLKNRKEPQKKD